MANETLVSMGANSAKINFTNGYDPEAVLDHIHTFITNHGQTCLNTDGNALAQGEVTEYKHHRSYKALNLDGSTFKYMATYQNDVQKSVCCVGAEEMNGDNANKVKKANDHYNKSSEKNQLHQNPDNKSIRDQAGSFYIFATSQYFYMVLCYDSGHMGSLEGNGGEGVFEIECSNPDDPEKDKSTVQLNSILLTGHNLYYGKHAVSPTRGVNGSNDQGFTRISTPNGSQGRTRTSTSSSEFNDFNHMYDVIGSQPSPVGGGNVHQVYEMYVTYDAQTQAPYVKGRLVGIKTFTRMSGELSDIFKIKCNDKMLLDSNGTDTDHFIIKHGNSGSFGIPL